MNVAVRKSNVYGNAKIPPSKSVVHRLMIATALSGGELLVSDGGKDMQATAECLKIMSPSIARFINRNYDSCGECYINKDCEGCGVKELQTGNACGADIPTLNAGESGSTLRFLLPVVCSIGMECVIGGEGRLKDRPLDGLMDALVAHGAIIQKVGKSQLPLCVGGRLECGVYEIDGSVSSQYVTGLLFALPLLDGDSKIVIKGELVSANYVDITLGVLSEFGIKIIKTKNGFAVPGKQRYVSPKNVGIEGDWSSAAFMLALGTLAGEVRVEGLRANSLQGDKIVVELLREAGAEIVEDGDSFIAKRSLLHPIDFDIKHCPDVAPIMAAILSFADGVSHIKSVDRLRAKESDRLSSIIQLLADFGIRTEYGDGELAICGGEHKPCHTSGFSDHRMAMSAVVMALCTEGESVVCGVECVDKSYPAFIEQARALGADIRFCEE